MPYRLRRRADVGLGVATVLRLHRHNLHQHDEDGDEHQHDRGNQRLNDRVSFVDLRGGHDGFEAEAG